MNFLINNIPLIAIALRIIGFSLILVFCIPLQAKETRVKNGLRTLRWQLLCGGFVLLIINVTSIWLLLEVLFSHVPQPPINSVLQLINGIAYLCMGVIGYAIYHTQYSEENKKRHEEIDKMEHSETHPG